MQVYAVHIPYVSTQVSPFRMRPTSQPIHSKHFSERSTNSATSTVAINGNNGKHTGKPNQTQDVGSNSWTACEDKKQSCWDHNYCDHGQQRGYKTWFWLRDGVCMCNNGWDMLCCCVSSFCLNFHPLTFLPHSIKVPPNRSTDLTSTWQAKLHGPRPWRRDPEAW